MSVSDVFSCQYFGSQRHPGSSGLGGWAGQGPRGDLLSPRSGSGSGGAGRSSVEPEERWRALTVRGSRPGTRSSSRGLSSHPRESEGGTHTSRHHHTSRPLEHDDRPAGSTTHGVAGIGETGTDGGWSVSCTG